MEDENLSRKTQSWAGILKHARGRRKTVEILGSVVRAQHTLERTFTEHLMQSRALPW